VLVLGIDCSTTASKAIAWDADGKAVAEGRRTFSLANPEPDGWEQDAEDWWTATLGAVRDCTTALGARAKEVRAIGIAHQRETFVLTDAAGAPLCPALVWMDARGRSAVRTAVDQLGADRLHRLSGKPACVTPSLYKLMWLLDRVPELRERHPVVLDVHAFLVWRLTGQKRTSLAAADPLGLVDMRRRAWSQPLVELSGIDATALPELVEPGRVCGTLRAEVASAIGLETGLPIVAGAGDGQAAGLGAGIVEPGVAYLNLGTAVVSGVVSASYRTDPAFRTLFGASPNRYFLETDLKGGTFILSWLSEKWAGSGRPVGEVLSELEQASGKLPAGAEGLMLVPYWNGVMNPYWDDDATGITVGWTGRHEPRHLYRAALEGIAFEQRLHTTGVERATSEPIREMVAMGGGARSDLFCQIMADVLGRPVIRARTSEATALGAGILAATAAGLHSSIDAAVEKMTGRGVAFEPGPLRDAYDHLYREVYVQLYPALREALGKLTMLTRASSESDPPRDG
jgi:sugar (pentulose or hexulose) kinase